MWVSEVGSVGAFATCRDSGRRPDPGGAAIRLPRRASELDAAGSAADPTAADSAFGAGAAFDSTAPEVTDRYARTDEEGDPVEHDCETGECPEEEPPRQESMRGADREASGDTATDATARL